MTVLCGPLQLIDIQSLVESCTDEWYNQTLCKVNESVELRPRQGYVVPKGVVHKTRAPEKTIVLMIETAGIVPTGDA